MGTDDFQNVSVVYGLDSQILANCFKTFASYLDVPKKDWNKYHAPYKDLISYILYLLIGGTKEDTTLILEVKNLYSSN
jgi:hypothetical protein